MPDGRPPTLRARVSNRLSLNYSLFRTAQALALHRLYVDNHDIRNTAILAGSGRSGTTWVQEIINYRNGFRIISEPFDPLKVPLVQHFRYGQYIRPDDRDPRFLEPATAILSGRISGYRVDKFNRKRFVHRRLVKEIHVHQMLKWIKANFPEIPMVILLRHPCAVVNSNMKLHFETHLRHLLDQPELMEDHLDPFRSALEGATDPFDKYVFMWCADNYVWLKQFEPGEIEVVFYENLCVQPETEIKRILAALGESYDPAMLEKMRSPSRMSRKQSAVVTGESLTDSWRKNLTPDQVARTIEILRLFGLDRIYGEGSMPLVSDSREVLSLIPSGENRGAVRVP